MLPNYSLPRKAKRDDWLPVRGWPNSRVTDPARVPLDVHEAILREKMDNLTQLMRAPEVEDPVVEEVRRTDMNELPERESLSQAARKLSIASQLAWAENPPQMLSEKEQARLARLQKALEICQARRNEEELFKLRRIASETLMKGIIPDVEPGEPLEPVAKNDDLEARQLRARNAFETKKETQERRRERYPEDEANDFDPYEAYERTGNFGVINPTNRMMNATIECYYRGKIEKFHPIRKRSPKGHLLNDYITTPARVKKLLIDKNKGLHWDDIKTCVLSAQYEVDLRVSTGSEPITNDYRTVDLRFGLGKSLLVLMHEQPHLWRSELIEISEGYKRYVAWLCNKTDCYWVIQKIATKSKYPFNISRYSEKLSETESAERVEIRAHYLCSKQLKYHLNRLADEGFQVIQQVPEDVSESVFLVTLAKKPS